MTTSSHFSESVNHSASYSHITRVHVTGSSCKRGVEPPAVSFKVKHWRGNWTFILAPTMERKECFGFFFPGFLEGTQVSSRWQEDETQRQPGESLEGEPGSGSSQVLSWSALNKRDTAYSICSFLLCLITTGGSYTHVIFTKGNSGLLEKKFTYSAHDSMFNCVKSRKWSQNCLLPVSICATIWEK